MELSDLFSEQTFQDLALPATLLNISLTVVSGLILGWHYRRFAQVLSNKTKMSSVFVAVALTTLMVVSAVKTSLALSLGLIGALSIVRFRTPIKEPEDLAYMFLSVAIGVGLGADQRAITILITGVVLVVLGLRGGIIGKSSQLRTVVQVMMPLRGETAQQQGATLIDKLIPAIESVCRRVDLRRVDCHAEEFSASLFVEVPSANALPLLLERVQGVLPGASVSVIEREGLE